MNGQNIRPFVDGDKRGSVADVGRSLLPVDELYQRRLQVVHHQLLLRLVDPPPLLNS